MMPLYTYVIICICKSSSYAYILQGTGECFIFSFPSYKNILLIMVTFAVFNRPAPPPSFLYKSPQFPRILISPTETKDVCETRSRM